MKASVSCANQSSKLLSVYHCNRTFLNWIQYGDMFMILLFTLKNITEGMFIFNAISKLHCHKSLDNSSQVRQEI
jgi:hypothetical protein